MRTLNSQPHSQTGFLHSFRPSTPYGRNRVSRILPATMISYRGGPRNLHHVSKRTCSESTSIGVKESLVVSYDPREQEHLRRTSGSEPHTLLGEAGAQGNGVQLFAFLIPPGGSNFSFIDHQCAVDKPYTNKAIAQVNSIAPIVVTVVPMEARSGSPLTI
jgi:hypothetical protein